MNALPLGPLGISWGFQKEIMGNPKYSTTNPLFCPQLLWDFPTNLPALDVGGR